MEQLQNALVMQAYADTFHDFGKDDHDKRCALNFKGDQKVPAFHEANLKKRRAFTSDTQVDESVLLDRIVPGKLSVSGKDTYERKVKNIVEDILCLGTEKETCELYPVTIDMIVDRADVANTLVPNSDASANATAYYGVLIDTGSSGFLLNRPNFFNIQTIMSALDEAPKSKKKRIIVRLETEDLALDMNNDIQIKTRSIALPEASITEPTAKVRMPNMSFQLEQNEINMISFAGGGNLDHTLLHTKVLDL